MTAPERIWAMRYYGKGDEGFWDTTHSPHAKEDAQHEYIIHTRDALAASPLVQEIVAEAVKWQPIETAPKYDGSMRVNVLAWNQYMQTVEKVIPDGDWWRMRGAECVYTHWMPLPAPPAAIRARGEGQPQEKGE